MKEFTVKELNTMYHTLSLYISKLRKDVTQYESQNDFQQSQKNKIIKDLDDTINLQEKLEDYIYTVSVQKGEIID